MISLFDFYINILEIFSYGITIYFVFLFFKNYKSISVISLSKELAESILKTRKTVKYYIRYNISYIILIMLSFVAYTIYTDFITKNDFSSEMTIAIVGLLFLSVIIIALMWGFYQLIYGFLLKKLKKNYEELQKIDL